MWCGGCCSGVGATLQWGAAVVWVLQLCGVWVLWWVLQWCDLWVADCRYSPRQLLKRLQTVNP